MSCPLPLRPRWVFAVLFVLTVPLFFSFLAGGFSVDEDPRETLLDPGDVFLPGPVCEVDDGDGSCPTIPSLRVPQPENFDLDGFAVELPLSVCDPQPAIPFPGILFSIDDADPGPLSGPPDNFTEIFFYDHCGVIDPVRGHYATTITEGSLGLGADPPVPGADDDVDAYETRDPLFYWQNQMNLIFTADAGSTGGLPPATPPAPIEGTIYFVNNVSGPGWWATPTSLGVPDTDNCDIDGIAPVNEPDPQFNWVVLFTTDANASCGLDPGDIYISNNQLPTGTALLFADDVVDLKIAANEQEEVDIDALAINTGGDFEIIVPEPFYKADWSNYAPSGMPDFSQDHTLFPPTWCGPTAVADSFWWFDSEMACERDRANGDLFETEPNDRCDSANELAELTPIPGDFSASPNDMDWYFFDIADKRHHQCTATISTCTLRQPGDADTQLWLYDDCRPFGPPIGLITQNDDGCPTDKQSEITVALDPGRYYVRVTRPSAAALAYTLSLGLDCHPLVERDLTLGSPVVDDHSAENVEHLIPALAVCMDTDDVTGGGTYKGTLPSRMQSCIDSWLAARSLHRDYYEQTVFAPQFEAVAEEIERSEDVILLLGFYFDSQQGWRRCGGHYVTAAGVDPQRLKISLSDPGINNAEVGAPGRVRGPKHDDHAPAFNPPPDHDTTLNLSHDLYTAGATAIGPPRSNWSLTGYATGGSPTRCADVARWCMPPVFGQNPVEPDDSQEPCFDPNAPVSVEVEAMIDVSPYQTPTCVQLDPGPTLVWPNNLRLGKGPCPGPVATAEAYDVIRGKLCNPHDATAPPRVELGPVHCLYDDSTVDQWDETSPDATYCFGSWFYLARLATDPNYGTSSEARIRVSSSGGCP